MIRLWKFLSVSIVIAVCLGLALMPVVGSAACPTPPTGTAGICAFDNATPEESVISITPGGSFDMNITVQNDNALSLLGASIFMEFDASLLNVTGIEDSLDWFMSLPENWSNTDGWLTAARGQSLQPCLNNTVIQHAVVHFQSTGVGGTTMVNFTNNATLGYTTEVTNCTGQDVLSWSSLQNVTVIIAGNQTLWVNVTPNGSGDVDISGASIPPSYPNTTEWSLGANVTLEAFPAAGWAFSNWTGDLTGNTTPDNITMDSDKNVTANFAELPPEISPDPDNLTFTAGVGGANPANQTLDICNSGGGILNWTLTDDAAWLSVSPTSGVDLANGECNSTQAAVNISGLTAGTYYANITITAPGASNSPQEVPVTLNLGVPAISVSPTPLTFTTNEGVNPPDQTLNICNSGTGILDWSLTDNAGWLSATPRSGSLAEDECEDVTVSVDVSGMEAGDYTATITITGSEKKVPVSLRIVSALPEIPVGPAQLSASALAITPQQVQSGQEVTISINVANTGGETGSYNAVLYINGVVEDSQSVSVAAGTSKNVIFTVTKTKAGVYDVSLAGQNGQFEVVSTSWFAGVGLGTGGIIAIVVIVIILIVAVVFILRGTTRPE